ALPSLPSFPTRRSSDLPCPEQRPARPSWRELLLGLTRSAASAGAGGQTRPLIGRDAETAGPDTWSGRRFPSHEIVPARVLESARSEEHTSELQSLAYLV